MLLVLVGLWPVVPEPSPANTIILNTTKNLPAFNVPRSERTTLFFLESNQLWQPEIGINQARFLVPCSLLAYNFPCHG